MVEEIVEEAEDRGDGGRWRRDDGGEGSGV